MVLRGKEVAALFLDFLALTVENIYCPETSVIEH